jgi:type I site-specific restriction endonuclease
MPPIAEEGLWPAQLTAVRNLEESMRDDRPRALVQMATGSGKTFTAITSIYRLIKCFCASNSHLLTEKLETPWKILRAQTNTRR